MPQIPSGFGQNRGILFLAEDRSLDRPISISLFYGRAIRLSGLCACKNDLAFGFHRAAAFLDADRKRSGRLDRLDRMEAGSDKPHARD